LLPLAYWQRHCQVLARAGRPKPQLYQGLGLFTGLEGSLYFSGITFTTVGYGDMTLPACWRLLSVAEAVNGVLTAGWSTAQLVYVVQRIITMRLEVEGRLPSPSGSVGGDHD
jgi:voltage-gated potassium channel Kch